VADCGVAQQADRMRRIGVLMAATADDPDFQAGSRRSAGCSNWLERRPQRADRHALATTNADDLRRHAAELVALAPDVIVAGSGTSTVAPLLQTTRTVPIVFAVVIDPVALASSTAWRAGGNATGSRFSNTA